MILKFEISDKSFSILKDIEDAKMAEFRDTEYGSLEKFKSSEEFERDKKNGMNSEKWFTVRNFCDLDDLKELVDCGLIDTSDMSWHLTYVVSNFGKKILKNLSDEKNSN